MDSGPVLLPNRPFIRDVDHRQVQHFQQAVICRKDRLGFGHLPQLAVEALDGVGRKDQPADLLWKRNIGAQIDPFIPSRFGNVGGISCPTSRRSPQGHPGRRFRP